MVNINKTNTERKAEEVAKELRQQAAQEGISQDEKESLEKQAVLTLEIAEKFSNFIRSQKN